LKAKDEAADVRGQQTVVPVVAGNIFIEKDSELILEESG
jgi:hypothetical protein